MNMLEGWALFVRTGNPHAYLQYRAVKEKDPQTLSQPFGGSLAAAGCDGQANGVTSAISEKQKETGHHAASDSQRAGHSRN